MRSISRLLTFFFVCTVSNLWATPGIERVSRASEHFIIQVEAKKASELDSLIPLCEELWSQLQAFTGYTPPGKISLVFRDEDDYSNGWAIPNTEMVSIWQTPLLFEFRGGTKWLHNVLSHELSHVFTMRAAGIDSRFLGLSLIGIKSREKGLSAMGSIAYVPEDMESWIAEGLAQLGAEITGNDQFDAQRSMLERIAWHSGTLPVDPLLRTFSGDSRDSELIYNQGYSFMRWVTLNGSFSVAKILSVAKNNSFREAVAQSFGKEFDEVFKMWRNFIATQYGQPDKSKTVVNSLITPPPNLRFMAATSALRANKSLWVISSHDNDYGVSSLWRIKDGSTKRLFREAYGRLKISADKTKILAIRELMSYDRKVIRTAFLIDENTGSTEQLTNELRVQDIDFLSNDSYVAVIRKDGKNQVVILNKNGTINQNLPFIAEGDVIQVASQKQPNGQDLIYAVIMGKQGFKLKNFTNEIWTDVFEDSIQRRDITILPQGILYSILNNGIWQIATKESQGTEKILSNVEGGAFAANLDDEGFFLYSNYGLQGFLISAGGLNSIVANTPQSPIPQSIPQVISTKLSMNSNTQKRQSVNDIYFLGYQLMLGFGDFGIKNDSLMSIEKKWLAGGGFFWSNPNMETILSLSAQGMKGAMGSKADWDPSVALQLSSEAWAPLLSLTLQYSEITADNIPKNLEDSADGNLPVIVTTAATLEAVQPINSHWGSFVALAYQSYGISVQKGANGQSLQAINAWQGIAGFYAGYKSPGVHGALSGWSGQLLGRKVVPSLGFSFDSLNTEESDENLSSWSIEGSFDMRTHLKRAILLGQTWNGVMSFTSEKRDWLYSLTSELGIPLGHWHASVGKDHRLTWLDPELWFSHTLIPQESLESDAEALAGFELHPAQFLRDPAWSEARTLHKATWKLSSLQKRSLNHDCSIYLYIKSISLWNTLSYWNLGISRQWNNNEGWKDIKYQVSFVL